MTLEERFSEMFPEYVVGSVFLSPYWDLFEAGAEIATEELQEDLKHKKIAIQNRKARIKDLEKQIEKLINFVLSKTECCDVCPITDTCINREGTCPYAGILAKGEEEVTREWLLQFISKEIKENESGNN